MIASGIYFRFKYNRKRNTFLSITKLHKLEITVKLKNTYQIEDCRGIMSHLETLISLGYVLNSI